MKTVGIFVAAALVGATSGYQNVRKLYEGRKIFDIHSSELTPENIELLHSIGADHIGNSEEGHRALNIAEEDVEILEKAGISMKDTTDHWINEFQSIMDDPNLFCNDSDDNCAARDLQSFYGSYQTFNALRNRIGNFVSGSSLATRTEIGRSAEGRPLDVVEIGDQTKPLVLVVCNVHAREWLTPMYCAYMVETLLADGGHRTLDDFSYAIIPSGNPDGYEYSRITDRGWRKTRGANSGSNCLGTDINRNWVDNWGGQNASPNPCDLTYRGSGPLSAVETRAIFNYANGRSVADRIISWIDYHSFSSVWLAPPGYRRGRLENREHERKQNACMQAAVDGVREETGLNFRFGPAGDVLGVAAGASDDHFYYEQGVIYSFTVEMRTRSFTPPASNIDPSNREIFAGTIAQIDCIKVEENIGGPPSPVPAPAPAPAPVPVPSPVPAPTPSPVNCGWFC